MKAISEIGQPATLCITHGLGGGTLKGVLQIALRFMGQEGAMKSATCYTFNVVCNGFPGQIQKVIKTNDNERQYVSTGN